MEKSPVKLNAQQKLLRKINEICECLQKETAIFIAVLKKFKTKLPRDQFMNSCGNVMRHLKYILNMNGLELIQSSIADNSNDFGNILDIVQNLSVHSYKLNEVCLKTFSLCEQRMRLGFFVVNYSLALGILARIYSLSKALRLLAARFVYFIKRKEISNADELESFATNMLLKIGYTEQDLHILTGGEPAVEELTNIDYGELILRDNLVAKKVKTPKNMNLPSGTNLKARFANINNLKCLRKECNKIVNRANATQKNQLKKILKITSDNTKKLREMGENSKVKREIQTGAAKVAQLFHSNYKDTSAKVKGYQQLSQSDDDTEPNDEISASTSATPTAPQQTNSSSDNWTKKEEFFKFMKSAKSTKEMLTMWKNMMKGNSEDLKELIPENSTKKHHVKVKKFLVKKLKMSKLAPTIKPKFQVKKTATQIASFFGKFSH